MRTRRHRGTRLLAVVGLLAATLAGAVATATPAAAAPVPDPERMSTALAASTVRVAVTPATINAVVAQGYRLTSLQLVSTAGPRFHAAFVANSGSYQRAWWWYHGLTAAQVSAKIAALNARIIDLEPYVVNGAVRFAVVLVRNTGVAAKSWWWLRDTNSAGISALASAKGARAIDLDRITMPNGKAYYTAVLIKNSGVDQRTWYQAYNLTLAQVGSFGSARSVTPISLQPRTIGRYDVLYAGGTPTRTTTLEVTPHEAQVRADQQGRRIVQIVPSPIAGLVATLSVDALDAESLRIRNALAPGLAGSSYGWFVKEIGAGVKTSLNADAPFEPASAIKAVHLLAALKEAAQGRPLDLDTNATWYAHPNAPTRAPGPAAYNNDKNVCAYSSTGTPLRTLPYADSYRTLLDRMMKYSDNRATDYFTSTIGFTKLNALMASLGMSRSVLRHRIGCGTTWKPNHAAVRNELTARDLTRLYEKVAGGSQLPPALQQEFFQRLAHGGVPDGALKTMIVDELTAAGVPADIRAGFLSLVTVWSKGGSYSLCPSSGSCSGRSRQIRTVGGIIEVPYLSGTQTKYRSYVFSQWLDKTVPCSFAAVNAGTCAAFNSAAQAYRTLEAERFRAVIRLAAATL